MTMDQVNTGSSLNRSSRINKLRHGNAWLAYSKLLELISKAMGRSLTCKASLVSGDNMIVVYPEIASLGIARYGFFWEGLTRMLLAHIRSGMAFLDGGAQLGYFTLLASWLVGESGHVHSFEPTPNTFKLLQMNAESKPNIHLNFAVVTSGRRTAILNDYGSSFSTFNSIYDANIPDQAGQAKAGRLVVETIPIDQYVREQNLAPNFVKIGAENADYENLAGMKETLSKFRPIMPVEVSDIDISDVPLSKDIVRFLVDRGYQSFEHRNGSILKHRLEDRY